MTKISSKSIVAASANQKIPVSPDNAISPNTIKIYADAAVDLTTVQAVALGASADDGTLYRITGTGGSPLPTGIDNILIWGASSMAGGFDYGNARASVTALGVYVPCTYNVATNKLRLQIRGYKTSLTTDQIKNLYVGGTYVEVVPAFGANTFTDVKHISTYLNIPGAVYNNAAGFYFSYDPDAGNILFNNPIDFLGAGGEYYIQFQQQFNSIDTILINTPVYVFDIGSFTPSTTGSGSADIYIDFDVIFN